MNASSKKTIFCLMGPTASGKTQLAVELVQRFPFEIISVDSAMVYRGMDIGTAKPDADILKIAPHRLLDIRDPLDVYSAAQFCEDAQREIEAIISAGKIPLLVGGTMMYFRAFLQGLSELPSANACLREALNQEGELQGWPTLHERLQKIDPQAAARIHPHDSQRIQRALEVFEITGKTLSYWQQENKMLSANFNVIQFALMPSDRSVLHVRIAQRFQNMLQDGFLLEVEKLFARKELNINLPSIRSVGYRQAWEYFLGNYSLSEMEEKAIIATRQLAKRQLTWLRNWSSLEVVDSEAQNVCEQVSEKVSRILPDVL